MFKTKSMMINEYLEEEGFFIILVISKTYVKMEISRSKDSLV